MYLKTAMNAGLMLTQHVVPFSSCAIEYIPYSIHQALLLTFKWKAMDLTNVPKAKYGKKYLSESPFQLNQISKAFDGGPIFLIFACRD